ncbi:MAG: phosphate signaling complex protein PhoU [Proteobacteria bacterium]|nr:phosphate signaling complex protein PhoU [Pseudomonadota bacterium]
MNNRHISSAFDEDLRELDALLEKMGSLALAQFVAVSDGLGQASADLTPLIANDKNIDALDEAVYDKVVEIIALRSPQAEDLRHIITALKIASYVERIGDYACNIIKRRNMMQAEGGDLGSLVAVNSIAGMAGEMLGDVLDARTRSDAEKAKAVWLCDIDLDVKHSEIYQAVYQTMVKQGTTPTGINTLFIAKNIERIGDFCTSIAEQIYFAVHGTMLDDQRPKADITSE